MTELRAACAGQSTLFESTDPDDHQRAVKICAACPVLETCKTDLAAEIGGGRYHYTGTRAGRGYGIQTIPVVCGTIEGWRRHRRTHSPVCGPCQDAYNTERDIRDREAREQLGTFRTRAQTYGAPSPHINAAIARAADIYHVTVDEITLQHKGRARVTAARRVACVAASTLGDSYLSIARSLNRDHSTVIKAVKSASHMEIVQGQQIAREIQQRAAA